jgi:hypothetical protein
MVAEDGEVAVAGRVSRNRWGWRLVGEMPGGRRTERISERDLEVLEFVARYGLVSRAAVATWANTARSVTLSRERRLREAGLLEVLPAVGDTGPLLLCTRLALRLLCRTELPLPRFSAGRAIHSAIVSRVAARLEASGEHLLSEREIFAAERAEGERIFSAERPGDRHHRPDLIRLADQPEGIEVELTEKAARRLDEILEAWRGAIIWEKVARVVYLCAPRALRYVERAIARTMTENHVTARPLTFPNLRLPRPEGHDSGAQARDVKGRRPDPLRGLTSAPAPLASRPGRGRGWA